MAYRVKRRSRKAKHAGDKDVLMKRVRKYKDSILKGTLLALDPSCASTASDPGYAIYEKGKLVDKGIIEVQGKGSMDVYQRLQAIRRCMVAEFTDPIDVIAIEDVSKLPYRTGSNNTTKSQGVMLAALDCDKVLEITPVVWQNVSKDFDYVKDDDVDAEYIGRAIVLMAQGEEEES